MALTVGRAVALAAGACAAIALAYLPPAPQANPAPGSLRFAASPVWRKRMETRAARSGLRLLQYRDSLTAALAGRPRDDLVVMVRGAVPDSVGDLVRAQLASLLPPPQASPARIGVLLSVGRSTAANNNENDPWLFWDVVSYLLPPATGDSVCLIVARLTVEDRRRARPLAAAVLGHLARNAQAMLGPCWFARQFGSPGRGTAQWLGAGGAMFAARFEGSHTPPRPHTRRTWFGETILFQPDEERGLGLPYELGSFALGSCLNGRTDRCAGVFHDPFTLLDEWMARAQPGLQGVVSTGWTRGGSSRWILADLLTEYGAERFGAFWRSEQPVDSAFAQAFGTTAGQWMQRWTKANLEPWVAGPRPRGGDVSLTLGVVGLLTVVGAVTAARRRMG